MSNDIAALYIRIDSTGAVTASKDLASLDTAAAKVEGSTKKVETATASASRSFGQMATAVKALAASYAVLKMAQYVKEVTMLAARYETLGVVMRIVGNNAGYSGAQMAAFARGLEKTGISMVEARQSLTRMVQANLDLAQSSKLARVAQDAAVIGNINSPEAFQRMVYGIQSGQVEILRTIGINVSFENSYQKVAKATGRITTQLSEAEKSQIRMNAVMDAGKMIAGTYEAAMGTAGKQVLSLQRHIDNLKVAFGLAFTPALAEIIETITGAITDLNGELSGDSKDKITAWGVNFRIALIDIQAEIRRLAMLLDKLGGTMTSAQMLLYGPGRALGVKSSTERFERAADANIGYEARYNASDKELERLMAKRIQLEQSLTAEGKASAEAAQDATEKKVLAAQRAAAATGKEVEADEKAVKAAQKLREEANKINETLGNDIKMSGLDDLEKKLFEIQIKYEKLGKNPLVDKGLLGKARGIEESAAISEANQKITESNKKMYEELKKGKEEYEALLADLQGAALKGHEKALHEISKAEEEVYKKIEKLLDEAKISWEQAELLFKLTGNKTEKSTADETVRSTQFEADYYSQIEGYAQQAYEKKLKLIELERQANIDLYKDNAEAAAAANAKANQDRIKAYSEKIDADQKWTKTVIGNFGSMLDAAKECYDEDSSEYNRLNDMKKAVLFAQLAMESVKNVRILA
ncbi:MAG: hypothetical protein M0R00_07105, partial [Candidatus Omnitrophica bacterium]|nr:hypothetical protein [Candidatus Omnitrophota bacterium]